MDPLGIDWHLVIMFGFHEIKRNLPPTPYFKFKFLL